VGVSHLSLQVSEEFMPSFQQVQTLENFLHSLPTSCPTQGEVKDLFGRLMGVQRDVGKIVKFRNQPGTLQ
jgi:hypothetical protein